MVAVAPMCQPLLSLVQVASLGSELSTRAAWGPQLFHRLVALVVCYLRHKQTRVHIRTVHLGSIIENIRLITAGAREQRVIDYCVCSEITLPSQPFPEARS